MKDDLICWDSSVLISWLPFDDDLLRLSGRDEVHGLTITACEVPGTNLSLF